MRRDNVNLHRENLSNEADIQLWLEFKSGSLPAYARLYEQYFHVLFKYSCKITLNRSLVLDVIQDLFIELWKNKQNLGTPTSVKHYLFKALRRKLYQQITNSGKDFYAQDITAFTGMEVAFSREYQLIGEQAKHEQLLELSKALASLTRRQKEVIFLKFYQNLSYDEISSIMSISIDAVYNLVSKAIDSLQKNTKKIDLFMLITLLSTAALWSL